MVNRLGLYRRKVLSILSLKKHIFIENTLRMAVRNKLLEKFAYSSVQTHMQLSKMFNVCRVGFKTTFAPDTSLVVVVVCYNIPHWQYTDRQGTYRPDVHKPQRPRAYQLYTTGLRSHYQYQRLWPDENI